MSAALDNISAAWRHIATLDAYPARSNLSALGKPENLRLIDNVRAKFFKDDASLAIFDWFCQYRIVEGYYDTEHADRLPNSPYSTEAWEKLVREAELANLPSVEGDDLLDRLDAWFLEAYALQTYAKPLPAMWC